MAILNFPDNPQNGDQYTGSNGTTYIYDGTKWVGHATGGAAGTNSIQNGNFVVQVDADGNLVLPVGSVVKDSAGNSIISTGSITFADINIYGSTSMDFANGGITLVPNRDAAYTNFGQYLNIYPTNAQDAPHIHIAAGVGGESAGDLVLGDDTQYVNINHQGYIEIQTKDPVRGWTNNWIFTSDGTLSHNGTLYVDNAVEASYGNTLYLNGSYISKGTQTVQFSNADGTGRTEYTVDGNTFSLGNILDLSVGNRVVYDNGTQYYPSSVTHDNITNIWTFTFSEPITLQATTSYVVDWFYYNPQGVQISGGENNWNFYPDGNFTQANIRTRATFNSSVNQTPAVVFSTPNYNVGMKLTLKVEGRLDGDNTNVDHTQMAEAVVAWSYNTTSEPVMSVYGVVHTSPTPLVTFSVQRNVVSNTVEVVATNSQTSNTMQVAVHAVQFGSYFD